ncbi:hypothetical protein EYF80_000008 [Liparis tanakae]|uniref:Uncharacterized protein n=1 Tax=Liparis tanakae TaxID=230148 RepID=A0A4Z2JGM2_9TELE|nr:hypothetical protein EYF80_000008 [Liparis tanakae]
MAASSRISEWSRKEEEAEEGEDAGISPRAALLRMRFAEAPFEAVSPKPAVRPGPRSPPCTRL